MTVLVTGVAGFIGFHTTKRLLARGDRVVGIDNLNDYYSVELKMARLAELQGRDNFTFHKVDFSDMEALRATLRNEKITRVIHLGAQAGVRYSLTNPFAYAQSNLIGHLNILELCRHTGGFKNLVYASSSSVYGGNTELPFSVTDRVDNPVSLYAATKKADELMSQAYAHLYRMPQTGLRFFTVYGPWGRPDMALWIFTDAILKNKPIHVFNHGDMRRDFTFVDDIVTGVIGTMDNPPVDDGRINANGSTAPHLVYNIGNHQSEQLTHMIEILEGCLGKKAEKIFEPMQQGDVKETYADITAIEKDIGFKPTTTIETGIPQFVTWFKNYHKIN
jgi:UDP-glucuronate 4-epimerase